VRSAPCRERLARDPLRVATVLAATARTIAERESLAIGVFAKSAMRFGKRLRAATSYWKARLDLDEAVFCAQRMGMPEGQFHPAVDQGYRGPAIERWRAALVKTASHSRSICCFGQMEGKDAGRG
jgi:hypothetical protein